MQNLYSLLVGLRYFRDPEELYLAWLRALLVSSGWWHVRWARCGLRILLVCVPMVNRLVLLVYL